MKSGQLPTEKYRAGANFSSVEVLSKEVLSKEF